MTSSLEAKPTGLVTGLPSELACGPVAALGIQASGHRSQQETVQRGTLGRARPSPEYPPSSCSSELRPGRGKGTVDKRSETQSCSPAERQAPNIRPQGAHWRPRDASQSKGLPGPSPWSARVRGFRRPMPEDRAGDKDQMMSALPPRLRGKRGHPAAQCQSPKADGQGGCRGLVG